MSSSIGHRLEQYTLKRPQEVLMVTAEIAGEWDQILIFKGFSSSLVRSTAFDPDVPVLPDDAEIKTIDRLQSPYRPEAPLYIQQGLALQDVLLLLEKVGV